MAFSTAYAFLLFAIVMCSVELKSRQLLHSTYKLFVLSVLCQFIGVALQTICYLKYAVMGVIPYKVKIIGGVFVGTSETLFLLVLLLLAKGYTTTRGRLPISASIKLTVFMNLYAITYVTIFIYETKVRSLPGDIVIKFAANMNINTIHIVIAGVRSGTSLVHVRISGRLRADSSTDSGLVDVHIFYSIHS